MRRTTITLLAAVVAVLGMFGVAYATHVFPDVEDDNAHADSIYWAHDAGVVVGYEDGTYGPEDNVTRGQAASMFFNYHEAFAPRDGEDGADGLAGADGADGARGPAGADGADGADGVSGYTVVRTIGENLNVGRSNAVVATCPAGTVVIGGGYDVNEGTWLDAVTGSAPRLNGESVFASEVTQSPNQWDVRVTPSNAGLKVAVFATCADVNLPAPS